MLLAQSQLLRDSNALFDRFGAYLCCLLKVSCCVIRMLFSITLGPIYAATKVSFGVIRMLRSIALGPIYAACSKSAVA
jgi:hypothetical protein